MSTETGAPDTRADAPPEPNADRPVITDHRVYAIKQILAGKGAGEPMLTTDVVAKLVEEAIAKNRPVAQPYPTERAVQRLRDSLNLQRYYGGRVVACARAATETAPLIVLAVGHPEIRALFAQLTDEERARVTLEYPPPPDPDGIK